MKEKTITEISEINKQRSDYWHRNQTRDWSLAEWGNACAGEMGELCNILKKILRYDTNLQQKETVSFEELVMKAELEIGDVFLYLNLISQKLNLDMYQCIAKTFNRVSDREGFSYKIPLKDNDR